MEPAADSNDAIGAKPAAPVHRQQNAQPCSTCGAGSAPSSYVYALGRIEPRFSNASVSKEFAQAVGRAETAGLTDRQTLHSILSKRQNRYLARQFCWVFAIQGVDTYLLVPRDSMDFEMLVESMRPAPRPTDIDVIIGLAGFDRAPANV
jgi:hypothetical protein